MDKIGGSMKKITIFITILITVLSFSTIVSANMNNGHKVVPMIKTYDVGEEDSNGHDLLRCSKCGAVGCRHDECPSQNFDCTNFYDECLSCGATY